ncbi:MAG: GNAT family N-acetyltransferase [Bacteroides sp.]|nr:GNAT family N-acetyltransferase [Bacteroides sp.]
MTCSNPTPDGITFVRLTDIDRLLAWRMEVIETVFGLQPPTASPQLMELCEENRRYYSAHLSDGSHYACIAVTENQEKAGCGAVCFHEELPSPDNPNGKCGYLMNIYVREPYRRRGIGRAIVSHLLDECHHRDITKIYLETTSQARSMYASIGFTEMEGLMKLE